MKPLHNGYCPSHFPLSVSNSLIIGMAYATVRTQNTLTLSLKTFEENDVSDTAFNSTYVSDVQSLIVKSTLATFFWHMIEMRGEIWIMQKAHFLKSECFACAWQYTIVWHPLVYLQTFHTITLIDVYSPNPKPDRWTFQSYYLDRCPVFFLYNVDSTTGYASLYLQSLQCNILDSVVQKGFYVTSN